MVPPTRKLQIFQIIGLICLPPACYNPTGQGTQTAQKGTLMYRQFVDRTRRARRVLFFLGMLCMPAVALGNSIVVGNHNLAPNQTGQVISLFMTGTDAYKNSEMRILINSGVAGAPVITHVFGDTDGAIFTPNMAGSLWENGSAGIAGNFPNGTTSVGTGLQTLASFATPGFTPSTANGIYVTLTFDTTGVAPGVYSFSLADLPLPTELLFGIDEQNEEIPVPLDIVNGTLTVVPEPASLMLGLFAMVGLAVVTIRSRRRAT